MNRRNPLFLALVAGDAMRKAYNEVSDKPPVEA
jgi:hypothetical protein